MWEGLSARKPRCLHASAAIPVPFMVAKIILHYFQAVPPRKCGRYCVELQREEANMELQWDEADTELHGEHAV